MTTRPRYRADVVRCADVLRLTPAERDGLLLAAGFAPETVPAADDLAASDGPSAATPTEQAEDAPGTSPPTGRTEDTPGRTMPTEQVEGIPGTALPTEQAGDIPVATFPPGQVVDTPAAAPRPLHRRRGLLIAGVVVAAVLASILAVTRLSDGPAYPAAADGESLILVAPFLNYTAGEQGFNVRGRIKRGIDQQIREAGLARVRTAEWPEEIGSELVALEAGRRSRATIVIWGEYDSGRVMANFTVPQAQSNDYNQRVVDIVSSPAELPTTINLELTDEVRSVALLTLGQLYLEQGEFDPAKTVLIQALEQPPVDPGALAGLWYRLGRAYQDGKLSDLDEAIWLFSKVLAVYPSSADVYNSRGLAYLARDRQGDTDRALADLTQAMAISPQTVAPFINRAVAYMERGRQGDLQRALADLDRAVSLDPESAGALVNRAAVYLRMGAPGGLDRAFDDLEQAIAIQPNLATAYVNRGNAYLERGQDGDLEKALEEFTRAIELDPSSPMAYFNRGLVYSALEDLDESTADLRRAQELSPRDFTFNNTLCWQLGVQGRPEAALPHCNLALEESPDGLALDSRGLVYGVMGRYSAAVADFRAFLAWAEESSKETCGDYYNPSRQAWIEKLEAGETPFDAETLHELRVRLATASGDPC